MRRRHKADAAELERIREGLVLSFDHVPASETFSLVCDVPFGARKGYRLFARLSATGVTKFRRVDYSQSCAEVGREYQLRRSQPPYVVQDAELAELPQAPGVMSLSFGFGTRMGGVKVWCDSVWIEELLAMAKKVGGETVYSDAATGAMLDFYCPFGEG